VARSQGDRGSLDAAGKSLPPLHLWIFHSVTRGCYVACETYKYIWNYSLGNSAGADTMNTPCLMTSKFCYRWQIKLPSGRSLPSDLPDGRGAWDFTSHVNAAAEMCSMDSMVLKPRTHRLAQVLKHSIVMKTDELYPANWSRERV
jgi:hypothetical protein